MELDNTIETKEDAQQPVEPVVDETEKTEATPQAEATEEDELYVDDSSGDQENSHKNEMTQAQAYAAFQKKKKQSAKRKEELDASEAREQKLQSELNELKKTVGSIVKGKPPTLEQFDFDETQYQKAVKEYYTEPEAQQKAETKQDNTKPVDDEAEFYLYQKEQELSKALPDYDNAKLSVVGEIEKLGIKDSGAVISQFASISKQRNIDIAKVIFAISKSPKILTDVAAAGNNVFAIADVLEAAEGKVKTRSKKQIESSPEPKINNSGPIDSNSVEVQKLREKWVKDPNTANYNNYQAAKTKKVN